ncbi:DUF3153 domain-containing protein [Argonema antarcticum]|uniref:DUF3153 domain-containing protein n=1 Tax=Argonema antarcticum TaxID=2942763 RepID=UPI0020121C7A|nr:DUF3153 domain-containing protein [Argonema antarcticum]MCL1470482.1 DUF3153 domain-containing protein [Argonema antarcticum A004/B2]
MKKEKIKPEESKRKKHFLFLLPFTFCLLAFLTGCVQYDLGVNFNNTNKGEIVQSIKLGEKLSAFSSETAEQWLNSIENRASQLRGTTKRISDRELIVTIPFNNGRELEEKFNEFFNPTYERESQSNTSTDGDFPVFKSQIALNQGNLWVAVRNRLSYDLDLRSLEVISPKSNIVVNPGSLLQLEFRLNTPWGATSVTNAENAISPETLQDGHQLVWMLQPGQVNHLEAVFWLPSPLGIGAIIIALFVAVGIYFKSRISPPVAIAKRPNAASAKVG